MHQLSPDTLFEILTFARWEEIANLCRSHPQVVQICRSERGQALIRHKRQEYREKQISDFLDYLDEHNLNLLAILKGRSKVGDIARFADITREDLENYEMMSQQLSLDFMKHYPQPRKNDIIKHDKIISQKLEQFERNLNLQFLLTNYYLFILVKMVINQRLQTYRS